MVHDKKFPHSVIKVPPPKKSDVIAIRLLICCGLLSMIIFCAWFFRIEHVGFTPIYCVLTFALIFKLVKMIHEWYHYWSVSVPKKPPLKTEWKVDVLTTSCPGEPREMVIRTLEAMVRIRYPHTNYLCDEGDDPVLKEICEKLGVVHVTRTEKTDAKAGNINNALKHATGDICVVLDPDHQPVPEFLHRTLPYFEDEKVGFVQCVQAYGNQSESLIARGAAEQTYHFYGPMMMSMNTYGTVQAIGANCTFRRTALDSIGGHAAGLSEDMHTAMQLHAKGWKSVYIPEILTRGLVPATLSSYYKQQLKWSRGTFELLFRVYPKLFRNFTWRQKIHYATIPLYFLFGLISFIDISIPLIALALAEVPWEVNLSTFALTFFPVVGLSMLIRMFAQRWLLERHERGFHFTGGILRNSTWWIFLIGFIYTIFKIRVPYIPTPKEDEHQNFWKLSVPNIAVVLATCLMVHYGLSKDWTPYSFAMAFCALLNAGMLGFVVVISQQKLIHQATSALNILPLIRTMCSKTLIFFTNVETLIYSILRNAPATLLIAISTVFLSYNSLNDETSLYSLVKQKEYGGFYSGIYTAGEQHLKTIVPLSEKGFQQKFDVISFDLEWKDGKNTPEETMSNISKRGATPLINWYPVFDHVKDNTKAMVAISHHQFDEYLKKCAEIFRQYRDPIFISFAPHFDDVSKPYSSAGFNEAPEFVAAWQYLYSYFNKLGISNLTWVWAPLHSTSLQYYPGEKFVDWIGFSCLNYGDNYKDNDWYDFGELYQHYHNKYIALGKPIMIREFGTTSGPEQAGWINQAFEDIKDKYPEIRSLVLYNQPKTIVLNRDGEKTEYTADFTFRGPRSFAAMALNYQKAPFVKKPYNQSYLASKLIAGSLHRESPVKGSPGKYQLMVNEQPYYIRGVAYNTAHDWRDGNIPLTRRQVENDMRLIKEMGANTIRRYGFGMYDRNVLNIANEFDLNVLYGFWFDPKVDFLKDTARVKKYIADVEQKVLAYRDHPSVIAWSLGNETWGLLKHRYSKPYLTKVRNEYVRLIEYLAERIHELDPEKPVFTCIEHEEYQLPGELVSFRDGAPSIDGIGINSYYKEQISKLNHIAWQFDSLRPYFISEFGPNGYWDPTYNKTINGSLLEDSETEKAGWYRDQWNNYVSAFKGYNMGGFAYCWHDRMEGTCTWFGLTDYKGRLKPSYHALKELWTGKQTEPIQQFYIQAPAGISPGSEYEFRAMSDKPGQNNLTYEWQLLKNEYLDEVDAVEFSENSGVARVVIPEEPSDYRLYLYVSDKKGNVSTASVPIKVK